MLNMAKAPQFKFDATKPFYAAVGAGDLAVEKARAFATEVQDKVANVDRDPKVLSERARTAVTARIEELQKDAKEARPRSRPRSRTCRPRPRSFRLASRRSSRTCRPSSRLCRARWRHSSRSCRPRPRSFRPRSRLS